MTEEPLAGERRQLPTRRKDDFEHLDEKIDERFDELTEKLSRFIKKALVGFVVIGLSSAIALVGYGYLLRQQHKTTDEIQAQRKEFVRRSCEEQNGRHNDTIRVLDKVLAQTQKEQKLPQKAVDAARAQNLLLINALVPIQNCHQLVKDATATPPTAGGS